MSWPTYALDELGEISRGRSRHRPRNAEHLYGGPYPFVQTADVKAAPLYLTEYSQTYSDAGLAQSKLWRAGTLCITIAANIAETCILGIDACFPDSIIGFIADPAKADAKFIKYQFDAVMREQMKRVSQGVAQDNLSQEKLLSFRFPVPDLPTQQRIAGILSAYDDLIETNRRRTLLLEQAARLLYREWFVHLRFPGHETAKIVDGLPEGWSRATIKDISSLISRGITPSYDDEATGIVINQKCIRDNRVSLNASRRQSKPVQKEKLVRKFDVLVNSTGAGTLGRVAQSFFDLPNLAVDSHVTILRPKEEMDSIWFGQTIVNQESLIETLGRGATNQTELGKDDLGRVEITCPAQNLRDEYGMKVGTLLKQSQLLSESNAHLARARDLLLPRLMDGRLPV